ncbi:beta-carotene 15,15'-monooxygenase [Corynebacterium tuberculostearicum]|uniref:beta-carotene 15,15'-monooxygenase n=1 Tax=Corynebacterium tuberculostearicum TaxID=38304 RepID=UPI002934FB26|nr:beta-carotene 15,15'-monooxygenase [Corynebacterium tuberculostearicum]MDV2428471.1 beta-carotene 15,15'-monooxygenase [Corynebacterium tuberculostearicum]
MKLLWYLGDWWSWSFFFLALLVMPVMAQGTWNVFPVIFSLSLILTLAPDFKKYQLVGLGSKIWNEHRRSLVALSALAAAIGALTVQLWWALPIYAVAAAWAMYRKAAPQRTGYTTTGTQPSSGFGWFPRTLAGQAIYRPQVKAWGAACLAQAIGYVLNRYKEEVPLLGFLGIFIWALSFAMFAAALHSLRVSLREYTVLGGSRAVWSRHTAVLGLIPVLVASTFSVVLANDGELVADIVLLSATCAPVVVSVEFLGKKNWHLVALYLVLVAGMALLHTLVPVSAGAQLLLAAAFYAVWALTLPSYIRRGNAHRGGMSAWMGIS